MITKKQWEAAKAEFKERAFERFIHNPLGTKENEWSFGDNSEIENCVKVAPCECFLKPLPELFAHDCDFYGNDAYRRWQKRFNHFIHSSDESGWYNCEHNDSVLTSSVHDYRRKEWK